VILQGSAVTRPRRWSAVWITSVRDDAKSADSGRKC
jgi:hypothetical protein